jgi:hypothetical protein
MGVRVLQVPLDDGTDEFIEVEVDAHNLGESSVVLAANDGSTATRASFSLARSMKRIMPALSTVVATLRSAEHTPDEISMEIGLAVGGETGIVFAKGTSEATFNIIMTWNNPKH